MERFLILNADDSDNDSTVGELLLQRGNLTRKQISRAKFMPNGILKNGIRCRITDKLHSGDQIRICLENPKNNSSHLVLPSGLPSLEILYEDEDILAVNKPYGLLTHPCGSHYADSLANIAAAYFHSKGEYIRIRPIGRLDKETSGIVLFAKNQPAAQRLQSQRDTRILSKEYLAVVHGALPVDPTETWHTISFPIIKESNHPIKMTTLFSPQSISSCTPDKYRHVFSASTHYQTLCHADSWSIVILRLDTGRTHQIRVHMKALGHPLLGDPLYNTQKSKTDQPVFCRTALHAWKTTFIQPFNGQTITLSAPLPDDFQQITSYLP